MINSRNKGHAFERQIKDELIELGFKNCVTSRYASKMMDDLKVDLCNCDPLLVQAKSWERAPAYHDVLESMPTNGLRCVYHKKSRKGVVVVMMKEDWHSILRTLIEHGLLNNKLVVG